MAFEKNIFSEQEGKLIRGRGRSEDVSNDLVQCQVAIIMDGPMLLRDGSYEKN